MTGVKRLKKLRTEAGLSQKELAQVLGVSQQSIYKYENALAEPELNKLIDIAKYFCVSVDYLIGNSDEPAATEDCSESEGRKLSLSGLEDDDIEAVYKMVDYLRRKNVKK